MLCLSEAMSGAEVEDRLPMADLGVRDELRPLVAADVGARPDVACRLAFLGHADACTDDY
jgi:hypothetical protein